jgi:hypothetical protein
LWLPAQSACNLNQTQKPKSGLLHRLLEDDELEARPLSSTKEKTITQKG